MNKQEALKKIEKLDGLTIKDKDFNFDIEMIPKGEALEIVNQLDEPEKPVVPQFVADFYESIKDGIENNIYDLCVQFHSDRGVLDKDIDSWFDDPKNKPIQTLVNMHQFGYEVEKEKLYTVEMPNPNSDDHLVLRKNIKGKVCVSLLHREYWRGYESTQLTEAEIKQDFDWAWQFAKEVEND